MAAHSFRTLAVAAAGTLVVALAACTSGSGGAGAFGPGPNNNAAPSRDPLPEVGNAVPPDWDVDTGPGRGYDLANGDYFSTAGLTTSFILNVPALIRDQKIRQQLLSDVNTR